MEKLSKYIGKSILMALAISTIIFIAGFFLFAGIEIEILVGVIISTTIFFCTYLLIDVIKVSREK